MNLMDLFIKIGVKDEATGPIGKISKGIGKGLATAAKLGTAAVGAAGTALGVLLKQSVQAYGEYEQLVGGAKKIFDQMDYSVIAKDAANAWETMNLSASQYLSMMNSVGATFAATMGDEKGYQTAKIGMQAIADYASGTGRNVEELNQKYALITRSAQSYQSIADQFSGILPATSKDFLKQAQAAGFLDKKYKELSKVPIAEYQEAVSKMLEKGVDDLNLTGNTAAETAGTITGSLAGMRAAWQNLITGLGDPNADLKELFGNLKKNAKNFVNNVRPVVKQALTSMTSLVKELAPVIAEELPELVEEVLPDLISAAWTLVKGVAAALPGMLKVIWETVDEAISKSKFGETWAHIKDKVSEAVQGIKERWDELKERAQPLIDKVSELWQKFKDWAKENDLLGLAIDGVGIIIEGIILTIGDMAVAFDAALVAGKKVAEGLKQAWGGFVGTLETVLEKLGLISQYEATADFSGHSGSFSSSGRGRVGGGFVPRAIGDNYVPYNNYPALLHRGEAVLTAREADAWRRGSGRGTVVNNFSFNGVSQSDMEMIADYVNRSLA